MGSGCLTSFASSELIAADRCAALHLSAPPPAAPRGRARWARACSLISRRTVLSQYDFLQFLWRGRRRTSRCVRACSSLRQVTWGALLEGVSPTEALIQLIASLTGLRPQIPCCPCLNGLIQFNVNRQRGNSATSISAASNCLPRGREGRLCFIAHLRRRLRQSDRRAALSLSERSRQRQPSPTRS